MFWKLLEVLIGLVNVYMGLDLFLILPNEYSVTEKLGKVILTMASALLVLGAMFAHKQHRANILLSWLIASLAYIGSHIYANGKCRYNSCINLYIYGILLVCMQAVIYKAYTKELEKLQDKDPNVSETKRVEEKPATPTAPQESNPPSYEAMVPQVHVA